MNQNDGLKFNPGLSLFSSHYTGKSNTRDTYVQVITMSYRLSWLGKSSRRAYELILAILDRGLSANQVLNNRPQSVCLFFCGINAGKSNRWK